MFFVSTIISEIKRPHVKSEICGEILHDLHPWFGIPESITDYIKGVRSRTFYAAEGEEGYIGFICIDDESDYGTEIYLIAVLSKYRNNGVGTKLLSHVESVLAKKNKKHLVVKTIAESHPSKEYAETRKFYLAKGFLPKEELPDEWDENNPCLLMTKELSR